jgi:TetR/AcrR family transcriptional regulator, transcriptional repressor for nem operon
LKNLESKSPSGIRKTMKSRDIQQGIFHSASSLFAALGYAGVSIRDIVASVNVPKGTFYNYFRSKEYLASMIVRAHFDDMALTLAIADKESAALRLRRHFVAISISNDLTASPGLLLGTLANELLGLPEDLSTQIRTGFRSWSDRVTHLLRLAQAQRHVSTEHDPRQLAAFLLDSWQGAMLATRRESPVASLENFLHFGFDPLVNTSESTGSLGSSVSSLIRANRTKKSRSAKTAIN